MSRGELSGDPLRTALAALDRSMPVDDSSSRQPAAGGGAAAESDPASDLAGMIARSEAASEAPVASLAPPPADRSIGAFVASAPVPEGSPTTALQGSLAGVRIAHKDILFTAGVPTRAGSRMLEHHVPVGDAVVVRRLREAGAIALGKVATHEFATGVTGTVCAGAPPRNPRAPDRIPGGSSSGSAAAVAAGLVDAATGTDTGGSIRIPAACCGVVGFKPTRGRVPTRGVIPFSWTLDHVGPLARSCDLARRLFEVMADEATAAEDTPRRYRVGLARPLLQQCTPGVVSAIEAAAAALRGDGHRVEEIDLPAAWETMTGIAAAIFLAEGAAFHGPGLRDYRERYRPETVALLDRASEVSGARYVEALRRRRQAIVAMESWLAEVDAVLLPALPCPAPMLDQERVDLPSGSRDVRTALTLFTRPFNVTGQPAMVLPVDERGGVPLAVQLAAGRGRDHRLLACGELLERLVGGAWR